MRLPPEPVLLAAKRWLDILPNSGGIPRAQALLTTHPNYSDLTPTQYATALTWIRELGLLNEVGSKVPTANQVMGAVFEKAAPPWVQDADELVQTPDELPSDIVSAGKALGLDPNDVFDQLLSSWGKVDKAIRERVGAAGEAALVALLRESTDGRVEHVSAWSDGFGYDIAFRLGAIAAHIEVKSTTRRGRFTAYLSRHEYNVMLRDPSWVLVTVHLTADLEMVGVGWVPREWIAANVPRDHGLFGSWASVKLKIPSDVVTDGLPHLETHFARQPPAW